MSRFSTGEFPGDEAGEELVTSLSQFFVLAREDSLHIKLRVYHFGKLLDERIRR